MSTINFDLTGFGIMIFLAIVFYIAHVQYMAGHDTWLFSHKTEQEKELQKAAIEKAKMEAKPTIK